jgi:hypothetical protein
MTHPLVMTGANADEVWPLVRDFHYSRRLPSAIRHCFALRKPGGLFGETGEPVAAVIYGNPVNRAWPQEALELQRLVRADACKAKLSEFVTWTLRWLRANTETPFVLSYADTGKGHHGGIYQASGFFYVHETGRYQDGLVHPETGDYIHGRQCNRMFGSRSLAALEANGGEYRPAWHETKFLYVKPIRQRKAALMRRFGWAELPFPKPHAARLLDAPGSPGCEPGANPGGRSIDREAA